MLQDLGHLLTSTVMLVAVGGLEILPVRGLVLQAGREQDNVLHGRGCTTLRSWRGVPFLLRAHSHCQAEGCVIRAHTRTIQLRVDKQPAANDMLPGVALWERR